MTRQEKLKSIAEKVVNKCLVVKPADRVLISCGDPFYFDFCSEAAAKIIQAQAYPLISMSSRALTLEKFQQSKKYLSQPNELSMNLIDAADVILGVNFPRDPSIYEKIDQEKLAASSNPGVLWMEKIKKRNRQRVNLKLASFLYPTPEAAKFYNLSYDEYTELVFSAMNVDYDAMRQKGEKIAKKIEGAERVRITSPAGTDLSLSLSGRKAFVDDGVHSEKDIQEAVFMSNLPAGEVCSAPVENSAEGIAVFEFNLFYGKRLKNLKLRFSRGKIVSMEGEEGVDFYREMIAQSTGPADNIAEIGFGMNPGIDRITGNLALDEKIDGTIHIATGDNRAMGGKQKSSFHHDLVMQKPTVEVDGEKIMIDGKYNL